MKKYLLLSLFSLNIFASETLLKKDPNFLENINKYLEKILFYDIYGFPIILLILIFGSIFFTLYHKFINIKGFKHSIDIVRGKYDDPKDPGELSHFKALMSALSGTIGLGNIAGVAIAVSTGGPGAIFWMFLLSFFGMTAKFHSTTLALIYRKKTCSEYSGGPMYYLKEGLSKKGPIMKKIGIILAILYAVFLLGGALGAGNMFQSNQSYSIIASTFNITNETLGQNIFAIIFISLLAVVIVGGVTRIGDWTSKLVPTMCAIYLIASIYIILSNFAEIPNMIILIIQSAFSENALYGGFLGVVIQGLKRSAFSNEAGLGSASIIHANAKTQHPVREGFVALLGPVIDTMIVCTSTALVILSTGVYKTAGDKNGVELTSAAFASEISFFPYILSICILLFAFSTCISWFHYAKKAWEFLLNQAKIPVNNLYARYILVSLFLICSYLGITNDLSIVLNFSDLLLLSMAFPNIIGCIILAPIVKDKLKEYMKKLKNNEFKTFK